jgi:hypothetical protein
MSFTIGYDAEIGLDGTGYFIKPGSFAVKIPRIRKATIRADGGESYIDLGPGRREWSMVILCLNDLFKYDGTSTSKTGQQYRDALYTSYTSSVGTTINFTDPLNGSAIAVHFDSYEEAIRDLHSQIIALATGGSSGTSYEVHIVLVEA